MAQIAYLLLCHKDPEGIVAQAERLTAAGDFVAIHFDGNSPEPAYRRLRAALDGNPRIAFAGRRVRCGWGEWSLVEATLAALRAADAGFPAATHFFMLSGDCMPIKSAAYARDFLDREDADHIECVDFFEGGWIKTGMVAERLTYRHYFNERRRKWLFYASLELQKRLGLSRKVPAGIEMMIGSQWWCLRRRTVEAVLEFAQERRDVMRFFRTTWIPDETFFQTLVRHLVPEAEIRARPLTFLMFSDYGMPVTFHNDHHDLLVAQDYLFARKISPDATELKARLGTLYASGRMEFGITGEGRRLYAYLTGRGRVGRRFAPRFWEAGGTLGRERRLLIVACKKWHVGERLAARIREAAGLPAVAYLFNEAETALPDLGGIETSPDKRNRHRRAVMRLIFEAEASDRLAFCIDPSDFAAIEDFYADRCETRLLEVDCALSDDYLAGLARRTGLASDATPAEALARLLPTIRADLAEESARIRDAGLPRFHRIAETAPAKANAEALAAFLGIDATAARAIAETPDLFAD